MPFSSKQWLVGSVRRHTLVLQKEAEARLKSHEEELSSGRVVPTLSTEAE
jgi:hypothetical protein